MRTSCDSLIEIVIFCLISQGVESKLRFFSRRVTEFQSKTPTYYIHLNFLRVINTHNFIQVEFSLFLHTVFILGAFNDIVCQRSNFKNWKRHSDVLQQRYRQLRMPEFQLLCKTAGTADQEQHLTGDFRCYFGTEVYNKLFLFSMIIFTFHVH